MHSYPHTIDNGHGERLTFLRRTMTPQGEMLEVENEVAPGIGPPMHTHYFQEESLTVVQGRMGYQRKGQPPQFAEAGESVTFEAGDWHRFWNAGDVPLLGRGYIRPPDNIEYFLGQLYASQKRSGGGRPDPFDAAFLVHHYRSEFGMDVPAVVGRVVFPLVARVGRLLGKYDHFADAPAPRALGRQ